MANKRQWSSPSAVKWKNNKVQSVVCGSLVPSHYGPEHANFLVKVFFFSSGCEALSSLLQVRFMLGV